MQRLETKKYTFTVEGETEKLYLDWLGKKINSCPDRKYNVNIKLVVEKNPYKYAKIVTSISTPEIYHICDIESNGEEHRKNFENVLKGLRDSKKEKGIDCYLGYSNFTFELWMILHKLDFNSSLSNRKQYLGYIQKAFDGKYLSLDKYKEEKEFQSLLSQLTIDDVKQAIIRSERIMSKKESDQIRPIKKYGFTYYEDNPSLTIQDTIKKILVTCGIM